MQIRSVFVALADSEARLVEFYRQFFELEPTVHLPQVYTEFELAGLRLGIFQPKAEHRQEFQGRGSMSLCVEVEQLEAAIARLAALGYSQPVEIISASHGRETYVYDPAGNRLILHQQAEVKPLS